MRWKIPKTTTNTRAAIHRFSFGFVNMCSSACTEMRSHLSQCMGTQFHFLILQTASSTSYFHSEYLSWKLPPSSCLSKHAMLGSYLRILAHTPILTFIPAFVLGCHGAILNYVHCGTICMNKHSAEPMCNDLRKRCRQHSLQRDMQEVRGHCLMNN